MKRIILGVAAMLVTFAFGIGVDRLIWSGSATNTPKIEPVIRDFKPVEPVLPVAPVAPAVPSSQESKIIFDFNEDTFFPHGSYYIEGKTPKEFADFHGLSIAFYENSDGAEAGDIAVFTEIGETYENVPAILGWITERRVIFVTSEHPTTEVEYRFDGEFIQSKAGAANGTTLRGTLTKSYRGEKIAQHVVTFRRERHAC